MHAMTHQVLVIAHADADGHLIAEQTRRNLDLIKGFGVQVVVDPARTKDHRVWTHLDAVKEIENADLIFFMDLMFAPETFAEEADALVDFVQRRPDKKFFLVDHHPLPLRRLGLADNLRAMYRPDVFECAIGPRSGMMVVAALCENQGPEVADIKQPIHEVLAVGVRRAAAHGGQLPGQKLLALLRSDRWDSLLQLGKDDPQFHRLPRGRRSAKQRISKTLDDVDKAASELLRHPASISKESNDAHSEITAMAYDLEVGQERFTSHAGQRNRLTNANTKSKDLETIVTLLEVAALSLTNEPGATFTLEDLIREARLIGGEEIDLEERDIKIVMKKSSFIRKVGSELRLR